MDLTVEILPVPREQLWPVPTPLCINEWSFYDPNHPEPVQVPAAQQDLHLPHLFNTNNGILAEQREDGTFNVYPPLPEVEMYLRSTGAEQRAIDLPIWNGQMPTSEDNQQRLLETLYPPDIAPVTHDETLVVPEKSLSVGTTVPFLFKLLRTLEQKSHGYEYDIIENALFNLTACVHRLHHRLLIIEDSLENRNPNDSMPYKASIEALLAQMTVDDTRYERSLAAINRHDQPPFIPRKITLFTNGTYPVVDEILRKITNWDRLKNLMESPEWTKKTAEITIPPDGYRDFRKKVGKWKDNLQLLPKVKHFLASSNFLPVCISPPSDSNGIPLPKQPSGAYVRISAFAPDTVKFPIEWNFKMELELTPEDIRCMATNILADPEVLEIYTLMKNRMNLAD